MKMPRGSHVHAVTHFNFKPSADVSRRLHVAAANAGMTMQDFVQDLMNKHLPRIRQAKAKDGVQEFEIT
jgi:hypothetical protein